MQWPCGEEDEDESPIVSSTVEDAAAAQRQWEKTQRRLHRPVRHRNHRSRLRHSVTQPSPSLSPSPSPVPTCLSPSPTSSCCPHSAGKDPRASVFATWLVRHYGERLLRGEASHCRPTSVSDYCRFSAQTLFAFPRVVDEHLQCSRCSHTSRQPEERREAEEECGVVDVAGGRGYLSAFLSTVYGVRSSVVDPSELRLDRFRRQFHERCQRMRARVKEGRTDTSQVPDGQLQPSTPPLTHRVADDGRGDLLPPLCLLSLLSLLSPLRCVAGDGCHLISHFRCPFPDSFSSPPHSSPQSDLPSLHSSPPSPLASPSPSSFASHPSLHHFPSTISSRLLNSRLSSASLLVGLHPDGATEAIVDFALQHGKPFAVVPCCVFPDHFKGRRLRDEGGAKNREVRSYEEFVEYLRQKDERVRVERLPFQGRNLVVFSDPPAPQPLQPIGEQSTAQQEDTETAVGT